MFKIIDLRKISVLLLPVFILSLLTSTLVLIRDQYKSDLYITTSSSGGNGGRIVILDPGHGGEDSGAISKNGVMEKDLNLAYALQIGEFLIEKGYVVVYTRTDDRMLYKPEENVKGIRKLSDLKTRCEIAARHKDSVFVSIHMNSFFDSKYSGLQIYSSELDNGSRELAEMIRSRVKEDVQPNNKRLVKGSEGIYILKNTENPAILIECGFLTNDEEAKRLSEKEYQKRLSFSVVCGIIEYIEGNNLKSTN